MKFFHSKLSYSKLSSNPKKTKKKTTRNVKLVSHWLSLRRDFLVNRSNNNKTRSEKSKTKREKNTSRVDFTKHFLRKTDIFFHFLFKAWSFIKCTLFSYDTKWESLTAKIRQLRKMTFGRIDSNSKKFNYCSLHS